MSTLLATAVATGVMIAGAFIVVFGRMLFAGDLSSVNPEWLSEFSTARYRPMQRLLNEEDYCFLERQPGYPRQMLRKFRAERRAFFRQYLQCLGQDFNQICGAIKLLTLTSAEDRPDLAGALLRQKCLFAYGIAVAHLRLSLHWLGVRPVDIGPLIESIDVLRQQLQLLATPAEADVMAS